VLRGYLTGIVDSHGYMLALLGDAERHGANLPCHTRVGRMWPETAAVLVAVNGEDRPEIRARTVVNCTNLHATLVALSMEGFRGLINLFGIESPGLTASLAIGDYVAELAESGR
jgi:Predicted dehydrogenase